MEAPRGWNRPGVPATHTSAAHRWLGLPFQSVFALDFEFVSESGAEPRPGLPGRARAALRPADPPVAGRARPEPPFPIDDDTLFVAYFASAELGCFLELGWPLPTRILDLYTEFRNATNGIPATGRPRPA